MGGQSGNGALSWPFLGRLLEEGAGSWRMRQEGLPQQKVLPKLKAGLGWKSGCRLPSQTAWALSPGLASSPRTVGPCLMLFLSLWLLRGSQVIEKFDYVFAENGTVQYKHGRLLSKQVSVPRP